MRTAPTKAYLLYLLLARTSPLGQKEAVSSAQTRPCLSTLRKGLERCALPGWVTVTVGIAVD